MSDGIKSAIGQIEPSLERRAVNTYLATYSEPARLQHGYAADSLPSYKPDIALWQVSGKGLYFEDPP